MLRKLKRHQFLFEELVKRDFKKKYKGSVLGVGWSLLSPLLMLLVMKVLFTQFFGRAVENYTTYLFAGLLVFAYFQESSKGGMSSLIGNAAIFTKVNVPKYLFPLAKNVQALLNFALTLVVFFVFAYLDGVRFTWKFLLLAYPVCTLFLFNVGLGLILSALFVFFRDVQYLWGVALRLIMYGSAVFYTVDQFPPAMKVLFALNPVYDHIAYIRTVVLHGQVPGWELHALLAAFAVGAAVLGGWFYKRYNTEFLYHV